MYAEIYFKVTCLWILHAFIIMLTISCWIVKHFSLLISFLFCSKCRCMRPFKMCSVKRIHAVYPCNTLFSAFLKRHYFNLLSIKHQNGWRLTERGNDSLLIYPSNGREMRIYTSPFLPSTCPSLSPSAFVSENIPVPHKPFTLSWRERIVCQRMLPKNQLFLSPWQQQNTRPKMEPKFTAF